jgi:hypothetical protein
MTKVQLISNFEFFMFPVNVLNSLLGFLLILEPFETDTATVPNPVLHFTYVPCNAEAVIFRRKY